MPIGDKAGAIPYTRSMTAPGPIDCDLHPTVPGLSALMPYLAEVWRETVPRRGSEPLVPISHPTGNPLSVRPDWRGADGLGATDAGRLAEQALDPFGTQAAILNCLYGAPVLFSDDLAGAFCRAANDWVAAEWLDRDPRLRASIVVPQLNAERAVEDVDLVCCVVDATLLGFPAQVDRGPLPPQGAWVQISGIFGREYWIDPSGQHYPIVEHARIAPVSIPSSPYLSP